MVFTNPAPLLRPADYPANHNHLMDSSRKDMEAKQRIPTFAEMKLSKTMLSRLPDLGLEKPTAVQGACIPEILGGKCVMAEAPTGCGKTMTFVIPVIEKWMEDPYGIYALVLAPTRELVHQIAQQFYVLGGNKIKLLEVIGGVDMQEQSSQLYKKPHFVVATVGRFMDLYKQDQDGFHKLFQNIKYVIVDELDAMDRLLGPNADEFWGSLPKCQQYLFFSATISESSSKRDWMDTLGDSKPFFQYRDARLDLDIVVASSTQQRYILCPPDFKDGYLVQFLRIIREGDFEVPINSIMIFVPTRKECETLSKMLNELNYSHVPLHSDMSQKLRLASLNEFKSSINNTLIATDIASRGLDIKSVDLVINYSVPWPVDYVHRVGRSGRGSRPGYAATLITPRDIPYLQNVEKFIKSKLTEYKINEKDVLEILAEVRATKKAAEIMVEESAPKRLKLND